MKQPGTFPSSDQSAWTCPVLLLCGLLVLCLAVSVSGCMVGHMHGGSPMPADLVARLEQGMSKAAVLELLGPPDTVGLRLQGSVFIYRYHSESDKGLELSLVSPSFQYESSDRRTARLVVFFDKKGLVTDFAAY